jgi:hypothetical protein
MVMTHMYPGEGTWNIRLWRSADKPGIYELELQDPKAGGVQTGTYAMRFPNPEYAHAWLSHFATVSTRLDDFTAGSFLEATGESGVWHPIVIALYHSAGPNGVFYESTWWYGAHAPTTRVDPLAEDTPEPDAQIESSPEPHRDADVTTEPELREVYALHHVTGVTNVFALQHFFHLDGNVKQAMWRINGEWDENFPLWEPIWLNAYVKTCFENEGKPIPDLGDESLDPFDLIAECEFEEVDPRLVDDVIKLFDCSAEIPGFVAEYLALGPDETLEYTDLLEEERRFFFEQGETLKLINEEFMKPPLYDEYLAFLSAGRPVTMMMIANVLARCAEWTYEQ